MTDQEILDKLLVIQKDLESWYKQVRGEYNRGKINMLIEVISIVKGENPITNNYSIRDTLE